MLYGKHDSGDQVPKPRAFVRDNQERTRYSPGNLGKAGQRRGESRQRTYFYLRHVDFASRAHEPGLRRLRVDARNTEDKRARTPPEVVESAIVESARKNVHVLCISCSMNGVE